MDGMCYYKVINQDSELFNNCRNFLEREKELIKIQKETIEEKVPKFTLYRSEKCFYRIPRYIGFVFEDPDSLDPKEWTTKMDGKYLLSTPNKRTKKGKEIMRFLDNFERTSCWDVDRILGIMKQFIHGSFNVANLFIYNECLYIMFDVKFREEFENGNSDFIEITYGEMMKAIDDYNDSLKKSNEK